MGDHQIYVIIVTDKDYLVWDADLPDFRICMSICLILYKFKCLYTQTHTELKVTDVKLKKHVYVLHLN